MNINFMPQVKWEREMATGKTEAAIQHKRKMNERKHKFYKICIYILHINIYIKWYEEAFVWLLAWMFCLWNTEDRSECYAEWNAKKWNRATLNIQKKRKEKKRKRVHIASMVKHIKNNGTTHDDDDDDDGHDKKWPWEQRHADRCRCTQFFCAVHSCCPSNYYFIHMYCVVAGLSFSLFDTWFSMILRIALSISRLSKRAHKKTEHTHSV